MSTKPGEVQYGQWWRHNVLDQPPTDLHAAQRLLRESVQRFIDVGVQHTTVSMIGSALLDALAGAAERAGEPRALGATLATGYGAMEETRLIEDLWAASRDQIAMDEFLRRHGYHGPNEGDLSACVWREDGSPLDAILASYRKRKVETPPSGSRSRRS